MGLISLNDTAFTSGFLGSTTGGGFGSSFGFGFGSGSFGFGSGSGSGSGGFVTTGVVAGGVGVEVGGVTTGALGFSGCVSRGLLSATSTGFDLLTPAHTPNPNPRTTRTA